MTFGIEIDSEDDGGWLAEAPALPGVMCYGLTRDEVVVRAQALALRVMRTAPVRIESLASCPRSNEVGNLFGCGFL